MKRKLLIYPFLAFALINCGSDDSDNVLKDQTGIVLTEVSCNTENSGLAYSIDVDGLDNPEFIITATLPDTFKQEGLRIEFDMEASNDGITFCTDNFLPNQFYKVSNVSIITDEN